MDTVPVLQEAMGVHLHSFAVYASHNLEVLISFPDTGGELSAGLGHLI